MATGGTNRLAGCTRALATIVEDDDGTYVADKAPDRGNAALGKDVDGLIGMAVAPCAEGRKSHHNVAEPVW